MKAASTAKLFSDVVDYAASYELFQSQFDRHIMHDVDVKCGVANQFGRDDQFCKHGRP